jgi:protein TonB
MNFAQEKNGSSRFMGFGIVVLIHVLLVWAIASGLARKAVEAVTGPIETKVIEEKVKPPEEIKKIELPPPDLKAPPPPFIPPPEFQVTAPAPPAPAIASTQVAPPQQQVRAAPAPAAPAPPAPPPVRTGPVKAGMVCTKMGKPEVPSVNWSGEALFRVVATVKSGRVSGIEVQSLRSGVDRKAQRALVAAIEETLRDTYECPGDHVFEQEFQFKIE